MSEPTVKVLEHALEQHWVRNRLRLSGLHAMRMDVIHGKAGELVMDISAYVWSQKIQDETAALEVRYPASLWQAFKSRWAPGWVLRRWPVKKTKVTSVCRFRTVALMPEYKYEAPPGTGRHVIKTFVEEVSRDEESAL